MKEIRVKAKNDIVLAIIPNLLFQRISSKYDYLVTKVTRDEVDLQSIENGGCRHLLTVDKKDFKKLLENGELIAI